MEKPAVGWYIFCLGERETVETADTPQEWEQGQWEAAKNVNDQQSCPISNAFKSPSPFFFFLGRSIFIIFGGTGSLLQHVCLLQLQKAWASHHVGFSCFGARALGTWAQLPQGMCNLPGPGIEPMCPALAGSFQGFPGGANGKEPAGQCRRQKRHPNFKN